MSSEKEGLGNLRHRSNADGSNKNDQHGEKTKIPYKKVQKEKEPNLFLLLCYWLFRKSIKLCFYLFLLSILAIIIALFAVTSPIEPQKYSLKLPRRFEGVLKPNNLLSRAQKWFEGRIEGPESIAVHPSKNVTGKIYTGTADGKVLMLSPDEMKVIAELGEPPCGGGWYDEENCGRPLGMRFDASGSLIVADAYKGLFKVDKDTGDFKQLLSSGERINNHKPKFINDLDIASDGKIYFTDSSKKWERRDVTYLVLEAAADGRVMCYDPATKTTEVVVDNLIFANGIQLSPNQDFLLIAETTIARISKYHLSGPNKGKVEVFIDNLPGLPDNIRSSSTGGYWVAFAGVRRRGKFSLLDWASQKPWFRKYITKVIPQVILKNAVPSYGLIVEINQKGKIIRSFHDPTGTVLSSVSQVTEVNKVLYMGSYYLPYISVVDLKSVKIKPATEK